MVQLKIFFTDFWPTFQMEDNFIVSALQDRYTVCIDPEHPDYVFYSAFGAKHFRYPEAVKIYYTGENDVPDFNLCDYGIASAFMDFEDRYFRLPYNAQKAHPMRERRMLSVFKDCIVF